MGGPPRLQKVFEMLASYYPHTITDKDMVAFLRIWSTLPHAINAERKVWRDVSALKRYLQKSSSRWTVKTDSRGNYQLVPKAS